MCVVCACVYWCVHLYMHLWRLEGYNRCLPLSFLALFICVCINEYVLACMCGIHVPMCACRPEEGVRFLGSGVTGVCKMLCFMVLVLGPELWFLWVSRTCLCHLVSTFIFRVRKVLLLSSELTDQLDWLASKSLQSSLLCLPNTD